MLFAPRFPQERFFMLAPVAVGTFCLLSNRGNHSKEFKSQEMSGDVHALSVPQHEAPWLCRELYGQLGSI